MWDSSRMTLRCSSLLFYKGKTNPYWYFSMSLRTYFISTVAHNQRINVQVCNFNHNVIKSVQVKRSSCARLGSAEICRGQELGGWVGLAGIWVFLPRFLHFALFLRTLNMGQATCLTEASTIKQPPSGQFILETSSYNSKKRVRIILSGRALLDQIDPQSSHLSPALFQFLFIDIAVMGSVFLSSRYAQSLMSLQCCFKLHRDRICSPWRFLN